MDTVKRIAKRMSPKENRKSYKEECSVFLSHRKKESLWERISIWKEDVICIYQRLRYGYCYRDIWSSGNKLKKSESTAAMRFQGFQRAHCGTHTRGEIPEFIFSM